MAEHDEHGAKSDEHGPSGAHAHGGGHGGGGTHEEHEGAPEWLISFADNVALMMGFFVILLALNMTPKGSGESDEPTSKNGPQPAMLDAIISIREAFNNPVSLNSKDPDDLPLIRRMKQRAGEGESSMDGPDGEHHDVQAPRPSDYQDITGLVQFDEGVTTLNELGRRTAVDVAQYLRGRRWIVELRGHASASEAFQQEERGRRVSYERAMAVAQILVASGVKWEQLRLVACGDKDPVKPGAYDKFGQRSNQRVEIVVTNYPLPGDPYSAEPESPLDQPAGTGGAGR